MSLTEAETQELQVERDQIVGRWTDARQRLLRSPSSVIGLVLIGLFVFVAVFAPLLAPYEPGDQNLSIIRPGVYPGPSAEHLLGVDQLGRDILSRIIYGARTSLVIGLVSLGFGAVVGLTIGSLAGAFGGRVDTVLMRLMDMMLAIPGLLLAIGVAAAIGRGLTAVMIAIGVVNVPVFARLLRSSMLSQRESDYVLAARSLGVKRGRIVVGHIIPNSIAPVIVAATLALATAIIDAAGLAFLGLGSADPGVAEWGRMLAETQSFLQNAPHAAIFPGLAIIISCLGFYLLGEGLREALDPKFRRCPPRARTSRRRRRPGSQRPRPCCRSGTCGWCSSAGAGGRSTPWTASASTSRLAGRSGWSASRAAARASPRWPSWGSCPSGGCRSAARSASPAGSCSSSPTRSCARSAGASWR